MVLLVVSMFLATRRRPDYVRKSVLHISYMVHIPWYMTRILRRHGWKADYLAIGTSAVWDRCDLHWLPRLHSGLAFDEFRFIWNTVSRYEVVHLHFAMPVSAIGWELPVLKRLGRKIVVHFRGCEARNRELNIRLHPEVNICTRCDYNARICRDRRIALRRWLARRYADVTLVTTPDLLDFVPQGIHFPFFAPEIQEAERKEAPERRTLRIVHVTNHPGIEGVDMVVPVVEKLRREGYAIDYRVLRGISHDQALREMRNADVTIGKLKMGYYANAQIESMALGVPAITYVRPEFITDELRNSGFILTHLRDLETTLRQLVDRPELLVQKRRIARQSILRIHDNDALARRLIEIYCSAGNDGLDLRRANAVTP
ncbi:MAG: glycosyltransferase [Steroidobacteraceae bacterium]|nr:glycosyltransferase [Steroidobacteraceae bacterium]